MRDGRCTMHDGASWRALALAVAWCAKLGVVPGQPRSCRPAAGDAAVAAEGVRTSAAERHQSPAAVSPAARAGSRAAHSAARAARSAARSAACGQPGCRFRQPSLPAPATGRAAGLPAGAAGRSCLPPRPRDVPAGSAVARAAGPATGLPARQPGAVDGLPARQLSYRITLTERNLAGRVLSPSISLTPSSDGWIAPPRRPVTPHIHTPVGLHVLGR